MAAVSVRDLNSEVKEKLRLRAARHGRSMEAEIRVILEDAVRDPSQSTGLLQGLRDRFAEVGGVDLDLPERSTPPRAPELSP